MQPSEQVKEYIRSHLEQGFSPQEIISQLKNAGWHDDHIQPAIQWALAAHTRPAPALHDLPPTTTAQQPLQAYAPARASSSMRLPIALGMIAALLLVGFAILVSARKGSESPQKTFELTVLKAMQTGTYRQKMTDSSESDGTINLDVQSDFSDPKNPKLSGNVTMIYSLDSQASVQGTLTIKQDVVAIQNTVYLKTTNFDIENMDSEVESQLLSLRKKSTDTVEDVLMGSFGIKSLNTWEKYDASKLNDLIAASGGDFSAILASGVAASNTILGEFIMGDLGAKASETARQLISSGMYTVDYKAVKSEKEGTTTYKTFPLKVHSDQAKNFQNSLISSLGLSDREKDIIGLKEVLAAEDYTLWINPSTHLPYKVTTSKSNKYKIEYSDFGAKYTITAPM